MQNNIWLLFNSDPVAYPVTVVSIASVRYNEENKLNFSSAGTESG